MKYKIGIFGSSVGDLSQVLPKATSLGEELGRHAEEVTIITGGCSGMPYVVAHEAKKSGVEIFGYSPARNLDEHKSMFPDDDIGVYEKLIFVPNDIVNVENKRVRMKFRNVTSTSECDAGIVISGRWGSLNEFTNLVDMQKVVGILTGTGGAADILPELTKKISKEGQGTVIFDDNPKKLIEKVLTELESKK